MAGNSTLKKEPWTVTRCCSMSVPWVRCLSVLVQLPMTASQF